MPLTYTPIRYPGGKSKIFPIVDAIIEASGLTGCTYAEAFCGGAGLAVKLLMKGRVSRIILNDLDPAIFSIWDVIVKCPETLCDFILKVPLTIEEWKIQSSIFANAAGPSLELGKAAFYLNRTNRSGIMQSGPIGGMNQTGKYKIDARFNRKELCKKIRSIAERSSDISLRNMEASSFIDEELRNLDGKLFANFDPPYVEKGPELYKNCFTDKDHDALAKVIGECKFPWIVTYDAVDLVDRAYSQFDRYSLTVGYSVHKPKIGSETLVVGPSVIVPEGLLHTRSRQR